MENTEMSLGLGTRHLSNFSDCKNADYTDRKDPSKIYNKHMRLIKNQPGVCLFVSNRKSLGSKKCLHSRITQDFDKLYDTSPNRKKEKLKNARLSNSTIYSNHMLSAIKSNSNLHKSNNYGPMHKPNPSRILKKSFNLNLKTLLPKIRKDLYEKISFDIN
jgi:hypothetical protein